MTDVCPTLKSGFKLLIVIPSLAKLSKFLASGVPIFLCSLSDSLISPSLVL